MLAFSGSPGVGSLNRRVPTGLCRPGSALGDRRALHGLWGGAGGPVGAAGGGGLHEASGCSTDAFLRVYAALAPPWATVAPSTGCEWSLTAQLCQRCGSVSTTLQAAPWIRAASLRACRSASAFAVKPPRVLARVP